MLRGIPIGLFALLVAAQAAADPVVSPDARRSTAEAR
jgi:hypothetical protein